MVRVIIWQWVSIVRSLVTPVKGRSPAYYNTNLVASLKCDVIKIFDKTWKLRERTSLLRVLSLLCNYTRAPRPPVVTYNQIKWQTSWLKKWWSRFIAGSCQVRIWAEKSIIQTYILGVSSVLHKKSGIIYQNRQRQLLPQQFLFIFL